jgi:hypothetical protein
MSEYVIVDSSAPASVLGQITVHDDEGGFAVIHDMEGLPGETVQFDSLDQVRQILSWMRPGFEIREA